jgi:hypothetical protein
MTKLMVNFRLFLKTALKICPALCGLLTCGFNGADGRIYATFYYEHPESHVVGFILLKIFEVRAFYVIDHRVYLHTILRAMVCLRLMLYRRRK